VCYKCVSLFYTKIYRKIRRSRYLEGSARYSEEKAIVKGRFSQQLK
jgi:hypothetical protein